MIARSLVLFDLTLGRLAGRGPIVIARRSTLRARERNGFELGRDYQHGQHRKELSTVATMLSAIQESVTSPRQSGAEQ